MKSLFIDTHASMLNLGIVEDSKLLKEIKLPSNQDHSSKTLLNIEQMFSDLKITPKDIDQIIVISGPGSYTGLRIGVTIAKTYAYTLNKIVIPASSLKAKALSITGFDYVVATIDAKRDHYFAAIYDKDYNEILKEQYISKDDLAKEVSKLKGTIKTVVDEQDLDILNIVTYYQIQAGVNPHSLVPNYLKDVYIEKK